MRRFKIETSQEIPEELPWEFSKYCKLQHLTLRECDVRELGCLPTSLLSLGLFASNSVNYFGQDTDWSGVEDLPNLQDLQIDYAIEGPQVRNVGLSPHALLMLVGNKSPGSDSAEEIICGASKYAPLTTLKMTLAEGVGQTLSYGPMHLANIIDIRGRALRHLAFCDLVHCVNDTVAKAIASTCVELETLELVEAPITGAGLAGIVRSLSKTLRSVHLNKCLEIGEPEELTQWARKLGVEIVVKKAKQLSTGKKVRYGH